MAEPVQETSRQLNKPGVYKHPETGAEVVARQHPKFGNAMADGLARVGFVFDREAPSKADELVQKQQAKTEQAGTSDEAVAAAQEKAQKEGKK